MTQARQLFTIDTHDKAVATQDHLMWRQWMSDHAKSYGAVDAFGDGTITTDFKGSAGQGLFEEPSLWITEVEGFSFMQGRKFFSNDLVTARAIHADLVRYANLSAEFAGIMCYNWTTDVPGETFNEWADHHLSEQPVNMPRITAIGIRQKHDVGVFMLSVWAEEHRAAYRLYVAPFTSGTL